MSRSSKMEGMVIRRANVGEADRIVTLLTPAGKRAIVVRGVRKITSKKAGTFELFHIVRLVVSEAGSLPHVQEVEIVRTFSGLRTELRAVSQAFWAAELIDKLVGDEEGAELYPALVEYVDRVATSATPLDVLAFELAVLSHLGWQPRVQECAHCGHKLVAGQLGWSHRLGGVIDGSCLSEFGCDRRISELGVKALRILATGHLGVSRRLRLAQSVEDELVDILHGYLESIGERRWHAPDLMATAAKVRPGLTDR